MSRNTNAARWISAAFLAIVVAGCGSSVSQSNYDKVTTSMTEDQVTAILGAGKEQSGGGIAGLSAKVVMWQDGNKSITVSFVNGKVATKAESGL